LDKDIKMFNKMMIKRLKISAFTLILSPFVLVNIINAQTSDLQIFEGLAEGLNNSQGSRTLTEDDANTEEDPVNSQFKRGNIDFTDSEYGYTGDRSFDSAPIPRDNAKPLEYFGYEYFQQAPSTFIQSTNVPVPSDYIIGPGDNFKIYLYGNFNKEFTAEVSREGLVFFPDLGPINVSGLTFSESEKVIKDIVANKMIGTDINITMGTLRSINVYVMGEAFQPGLYTVSSLSTLTNAIFASGGINTSGSLRNIQLKRDGEVISEFDFYDILLTW
jgi:Periplasmic protein involved in polysaccharide export